MTMKGIKRRAGKLTNSKRPTLQITKEDSANSIKFETLLHVAFEALDLIEIKAVQEGARVSPEVNQYRSVLETFKNAMVEEAKDGKKNAIYELGDMLDDWRKSNDLARVGEIQWFMLLNSTNTIIFGRMKPLYRAWRYMHLETKAKKLPRQQRKKWISQKKASYEDTLKRMTGILHGLAIRSELADKYREQLINFLDREVVVELK